MDQPSFTTNKGKENCIIDDLRYQNELDALIKDGWIIIQLNILLYSST